MDEQINVSPNEDLSGRRGEEVKVYTNSDDCQIDEVWNPRKLIPECLNALSSSSHWIESNRLLIRDSTCLPRFETMISPPFLNLSLPTEKTKLISIEANPTFSSECRSYDGNGSVDITKFLVGDFEDPEVLDWMIQTMIWDD